ncbi:aminotransferase class V-fold PLP-dependent enzyme [Thermocoleostomius sinensis]|uniref:Aminotransferase class V-fold PLP-dependent enzyme n=1 Tax=Thermocoleostomius sinensis A174 TaxID=2016057 RepID=A0A9E9C3Y4_9CYAN|nr:aminotransferase class V-fold PLP-dependent enzyme [Thermocoleostomius sinensis]WAL59431.1 aminotransferase class V-fold PLP-dependent enzyme [Thermocoleostomius sinensis A174]
MTQTASNLALLNQYRQQFPALSEKAYFNYGGQGPMPQGAMIAITQMHEYIQRSGPFSTEVNRWINLEAKRTREAIAAELGVAASTIALTENVSVGCNIALWGIDWRSGDHLLLSDCEHPGIVAAANEIQHRFGVEVSQCPLMETLNQGDPIAVIQAHLCPTTRLVVLSHILWNTGQVLPLQSIAQVCHAHSAEVPVRLLVDAAQSVGVLPLDLAELEVDFYAFTGHKWWCGPAGIGGLYVRPEAMVDLRPTFLGWRSVTKNEWGHPTGYEPDAKRYEVATSDYALFGGLQAAIAVHHQWGPAAARYHHIRELSRYLWQELCQLPQLTCLRTAPPDAGLVSFQLTNGKHQELVNELEQHGFLLRTILDPPCIRACVHYFTLESEIDRLVKLIRSLVG